MQKKNRPLIIAITGGIASGKSTFSKLIEEKGYRVYYTDKIGHDVLELDSIKKQIRENIGAEAFTNNKIDRKKLGEIVFSDKQKLAILNQISHTKIREQINSIIAESNEKIIFFEIPLLIESNLQESFHYNILITTDENIRTNRLINRDKITKEKALRIIKNQMSDEIKKEYVDLIIDNSFSKKFLEAQTNIFRQMINLIPKRKTKKLN